MGGLWDMQVDISMRQVFSGAELNLVREFWLNLQIQTSVTHG